MLMNVRDIFQKNSWAMKSFFMFTIIAAVFYGLKAQADVWQPSPGLMQTPIWPEGKMPDALSNSKPKPESVTTTTSDGTPTWKPVTDVWDVSQPTITVYSPKTKNTGAAVIVFPGGGFHGLAS